MINQVGKLSPEVVEKIKNVTLFTKRLLRNQFIGQSRSSLKGMGFDFDSLRDYAIGDDIRFIDWRGSSRTSSLLVRQFKQDQVKTVMLVVDISRSLMFGTLQQKKQIVNQIAAVIALIGHYSQDLVGLILFSDNVELYLPPRRDSNYINVIMKEIFSWEPKGTGTNSQHVQKYLLKAALKQAIVFWFSDCIDTNFEQTMQLLPSTHDVYVMRCLDALERSIPVIGSLLIQDIETNQLGYVTVAPNHSARLQKRLSMQDQITKKTGAKTIDITDTTAALQQIVSLFRVRMRA